jgi:serine/threonine-protein kinase
MQSGQRLGKYLLLDLLKSGGMATVYRAREMDTGRVVAIKILPPILAADPDFVARFKNEVAQVRKLAHPNIVPIESYGYDGQYFYFAMPLLDASLRDALIRQGRLAPHAALTITAQIASALTAVHTLGLIHRDIKPDNILLSDDLALLTDFGIVRLIEFTDAGQPPTLAGSGLPIGTPQYMAPEQLAGRYVDYRADLYALGAVLYETLTGQPPHIADTPYAIASRVLTDRIRPPSMLNPAIPAELDAVVMRALTRDPADRYADAADMRDALERIGERFWPDMVNPWDTVATEDWDRAYSGEGAGRNGARNRRMRAERVRRRPSQLALLVALAAVLLIVSAFCGISLAMNGLALGNTHVPPTSALAYDATYEGLAATATVLEQTPTVTTGPHTPTPTPRPPLPTRTPTPRRPTVTVGPGTPTPTPYPTDTPAPTATDTPAPTATDTPAPTATDTPEPTATDTPTS